MEKHLLLCDIQREMYSNALIVIVEYSDRGVNVLIDYSVKQRHLLEQLVFCHLSLIYLYLDLFINNLE